MKIDRFKIKMIVLLSFLFVFKISFSVVIMENVEVESVQVFLSDCIITIDDEEFNKASKIVITKLPNPGDFIELSGERIASKLRTVSKDKFKIPAKVKLRRRFSISTREEIQDIIKGKLEEYYSGKNKPDYDYTLNVGRKLRTPVGDVEYRLDSTKLEKERYGKFQVYLELFVENELAQRIPFIIEIKKIVSQYYLIKDVVKGEEFKESHLKKETREVYFDLKDEKFVIENAIGNVYQTDFKAGHKILNEDVGLRVTINKGKMVKLQLNFKGIVITDLAEALEDGKVGDIISLKNVRSGKKIMGKVLEDGTIEVEY